MLPLMIAIRYKKLIPHLTDGSSVIAASSAMLAGAYHQTSFYLASKAAVDAIARVAANELADRSIRVNILAPGVTDTPMNFGGKQQTK
jgi:NAD(P)-dependent dehydrogenase (short-subunit alcohol dehydrogenase family)